MEVVGLIKKTSDYKWKFPFSLPISCYLYLEPAPQLILTVLYGVIWIFIPQLSYPLEFLSLVGWTINIYHSMEADLDNPLDFGYTDISVCGKKTFSFVNWDSSLQPLSCLLIQWHSEPKISRWHSWFIRFTSITLYSLVKRDFVWLWFFVCFCFYHRKHNLIQPKGVDTSRNKTQNFVNGPLGKTVRVVTRISVPSYMG